MGEPLISEDVLNRLQLAAGFDHNQFQQPGVPILVNGYAPQSLAGFNLSWSLPLDPLAIRDYRNNITQPPNAVPYYDPPEVGGIFPERNANLRVHPEHLSILPLLIPAQNANVDIRQYHVVSGRNSLKQIAINEKEYVIRVVRHGNTVVLHRCETWPVDMNEPGCRFEQMCTPRCPPGASYNLLVKGQIGDLTTLITAQVDAVSEQNHASIELKTRKRGSNRDNSEITWLQSFLAGTQTVIIGERTNGEPPRLTNLVTHDVANMIGEPVQVNILQHLYQVLRFLQQHAQEGELYLLRRRAHQPGPGENIALYRVVNPDDRRDLEFLPPWALNQLLVNN